jgi:hypothetical protein
VIWPHLLGIISVTCKNNGTINSLLASLSKGTKPNESWPSSRGLHRRRYPTHLTSPVSKGHARSMHLPGCPRHEVSAVPPATGCLFPAEAVPAIALRRALLLRSRSCVEQMNSDTKNSTLGIIHSDGLNNQIAWSGERGWGSPGSEKSKVRRRNGTPAEKRGRDLGRASERSWARPN